MSQIAIRYAKALMEKSQEIGIDQKVFEDIHVIDQTLSGSRELNIFLKSPMITNKAKCNVLAAVFSSANPIVLRFFDILGQNQRFPMLKSIARCFLNLHEELKRRRKIYVTTAVAIDARLKGKILAKLKSFLKDDFIISNIVNEKVLGGFVFRIGDLQYDDTLRSKLERIRTKIK